MGREGFEPSKSKQRIYSPSHLAALESPPASTITNSSAVDRGKQMSHLPESNQRPTDYKSVALPAELKWHLFGITQLNSFDVYVQ